MKQKRLFQFILFIFIFFITTFAFSGYLELKKKEVSFRILEESVRELVKDAEGEFALFIKNLFFPYNEISFNIHQKFPAASLIKLPVLAAAFTAVKQGKVSFSRVVTIKREDIAGGSGVIKKMELPLRLTFKRLCEIMITYSDNTATNKVIDLLGFEYINEVFGEIGLKETFLQRKMMDFSLRKKGIENYTSAWDIGFLLEKIYRKELVDKKSSELMLSFLKKQKVNDRLPRYLPKDVTVAHKTGLEKEVVHDAGVIFTSRGNYLICVLTGGMGDYREAKKFIAQVSLIAYNLYQ